jgi:hypothetical protein
LKTQYKLKRGKKAKDCSYNGVHGISPLVEHLDAFNFCNFNFDMMHYMLNASNYFLKAYKGERGLQAGSRILEVSQETHMVLKYKKLRPRWTITNADQDLADAIQNGILFPPQYKNDFCFKNPFRLRGFLKAREHMIFLMVFSSFILSFTTIGEEYVTFAAMFASDLCMLFNPMLVVADVKSIIIPCVYETRGVQEGLFPESEQVFIFHEVIDVVNHILMFGHVRGLMCFASERANGLISQSLTKGGVNYLMTMYNRYILRENGCLMRFLDKPENNYDNCGVYSDFALKLYGASSFTKLRSDAQCKNLFRIVFEFLRTQELDNLFERSQFYRLYHAFQFLEKRGRRGSNTSKGFHYWFTSFAQVYDVHDAEGNRAFDLDKISVYFVRFHRVGTLPIDFAGALLGHVFEADVQFMMQFLHVNYLLVQSYEKIIVKGVRIDCRGKELRVGAHDDLPTSWHSKRLYKSWFQYKHQFLQIYYNNNNKKTRVETSRAIHHTRRFGQMVYAFRLNFPGEAALHGLAIGHCHVRTAFHSEKRWHHYVKPVGAVESDQFVCLNYVDSTAIGICAVNVNNKVMFSSEDATSFTPLATATKDANCYAQPNDMVLHRLYLIPLHPERLSIQYRNVIDDEDGTRVWEDKERMRELPGSDYVRSGVFKGFSPFHNFISVFISFVFSPLGTPSDTSV